MCSAPRFQLTPLETFTRHLFVPVTRRKISLDMIQFVFCFLNNLQSQKIVFIKEAETERGNVI